MLGTHKCFHPSCDKQVATDLFGCRAHWYALPIDMRNEIYRVYREWKSKRSMYHYGRMKEVQKKALNFVTNRAAQIAKLAPNDLARNLTSTHLNCIGSEAGAVGQANSETRTP